jgi:hypothetical protein
MQVEKGCSWRPLHGWTAAHGLRDSLVDFGGLWVARSGAIRVFAGYERLMSLMPPVGYFTQALPVLSASTLLMQDSRDTGVRRHPYKASSQESP